MGRRTTTTMRAEPLPKRHARRSPLSIVLRTVAIVAVVLLLLFVLAGFYFSGVLRSDALTPPLDESPTYELDVIEASSTKITLSGPDSSDQLDQQGFQGIEWDGGYILSPALAASTSDGKTRTDVRTVEPDSPVPPVGVTANVDPYAFDGDPMTAFGIPFTEVVYGSDSSVGSFPAWYIEGTSSTWAILVHGKGASREEALRMVPILHDLGYPMLIISYRNDVGQARDPSGYHQYGATEWQDLAGAVRFAGEHGATDHLLVGYSMGGAIVTSFLTQSPLRNFTKAAILDAPVLSFERLVDYQASQTNLPLLPIKVPGLLTQFAKWISSVRFDIDWEATDYLAKTNELHAPTLIIHGTQDTSVPYETSLEMADLRPDIVTLHTTSAGHVRSWNIDPDDYRAVVTEFLSGLD